MRILLTGGSGDLGTLLSCDFLQQGHSVANIDMAPPKIPGTDFHPGSILDRNLLSVAMQGIELVIHIAAWHGIHEAQKTKSPDEFHDLNVTGTYNVLQAAADAGVKKVLFISSTSIASRDSLYGHSKILGEEMARTYAARHEMNVVILRPRAFIPSWNRAVYKDFLEWAAWFGRGAVHIDDVKQAALIAAEMLASSKAPIKAPVYMIDGAYEYTTADLAGWDSDGPGSTFKKYYADFNEVAQKYGIDCLKKPRPLDITPGCQLPGYKPRYSMRNLLQELEIYGPSGPPAPFERKAL